MGRELVTYQQQYATWEAMLKRAQPRLAELLPDHNASRLCRMAMNSMVAGSPLLQCSMSSVLGGIMEAAQMGLEIATGGQCWLIPFKGEAKLVIGYRGMIDLMYRTGDVQLAQAEVVFTNDEFEFRRQWGGGTMPQIIHEPNESEDRGALRGAYFVGMLKGADHPVITYVSRPEIMEAKAHSHARKDSAWATHAAAMWMKTAVRRGEKWLPHNYSFARAVTIDTQADMGTQNLSVDTRDFDISDDEAAEIVAAEVIDSESR